MALKQPESMQDLVYFTHRDVQNGQVRMWVFRKQCPKCKGVMGKPKDAKGKIKIRAKEYSCEKCGYIEEKEVYENSLMANAEYACACGNKGEEQVPFKRKLVDGIPTIKITCSACGAKLDVTKKMKEKKGKN